MGMAVATDDITGLVLAGGRGLRMGGVDKGLQPYQGEALVAHAVQRLRPQVGRVALNANRHLEAYRHWSTEVWPDVLPDHPGPLAGMLTGLQRCATPYVATVPVDSPHFPLDVVGRLAAALHAEGADLAMVMAPDDDGQCRPQPVFCLLPKRLGSSLAEFMASGQRKVDRWTSQWKVAWVHYDDAQSFRNFNTLQDLHQPNAQP